MTDHVIQFHDLVGLIDSKIAELKVVGGGEEEINYLNGVKAQLIDWCDDNPIWSFVFRGSTPAG